MNKKILILFICIFLFYLTLITCGKDKNTDDSNQNKEKQTEKINNNNIIKNQSEKNDKHINKNTSKIEDKINTEKSSEKETKHNNKDTSEKKITENNNAEPKEEEGLDLKPLLFSPESFIYDENTRYYFISNINGESLEKDDNGYISKLSSKLKLIDDFFIDGSDNGVTLNAPKGMTVLNNTLYVTDIDTVRGFDVNTGKEKVSIENDLFSKEAQSLNDITKDTKGNLYVSDTSAGLIFKIDTNNENSTSIFIKIKSPNGICYNESNELLYVALWKGKGVYRVSLSGIVEGMDMFNEVGNLDGVDIYNNEIYLSDFTKGIIYKYQLNGKQELNIVKEGLKTPADINIDKVNGKLLIPLINSQDYSIIDLP